MTRKLYNPRPYAPMVQEHIVRHPRCAVWAGMGMGKGAMTLTALRALEFTEDPYPALAIGPKRVARDVWPDEARKWEHLKGVDCLPIVGDPEQRMRALRTDSRIYSINYENLPWLVEQWGDRWPYRTVIADESTKLKSYRGAYRTHPKTGTVYLQAPGGERSRSKALGKMAHEHVTRFIELTGTPSPNGLQDLWGQLWFLDKGERLGRTFESFKQRWFRAKYDGFGIEPLAHAEEEIHEKVKDLCLTVDAKDYFDLREPYVNNVYVDLPPVSMRLYKEMEKKMFIELEGSTVEAFNAAAKTTKCLQLANGAVYVDPTVQDDRDPRSKKWKPVHDVKMEALDSVIEEAGGNQMMIVYSFRSDRERILKAYPAAVDLATTKGLAEFKAGKVQLGVCHPGSLGHGVDGLQEHCWEITHFGHDWPLDTYDQVNARIGPVRQFQSGHTDRLVRINHIIARGTVDEDVLERRASKCTVQEALLNAAKRRHQK